MNTVYIEQMKCTLGFKVTRSTEHLYTYCLEHKAKRTHKYIECIVIEYIVNRVHSTHNTL